MLEEGKKEDRKIDEGLISGLKKIFKKLFNGGNDKTAKEFKDDVDNVIAALDGFKIDNIEKKWAKEGVTETMIDAIIYGMKHGYINVDGVDYGISNENIFNIFDENAIKKEQIQGIIDDIKSSLHIDFKYETNEEWKKEGYKDPEA